MSKLDDEEFDSTLLLTRKMAWDIIPCDEVIKFLPDLGLVPSSPDVAEMEHEESHDRLEKCMPLSVPVEVFSAIANEIMSQALLANSKVELPEEYASVFFEQNLMLIRGGVYAVLAQLFDCEQIAYGQDLKKEMGILDE